MTTEGDRINTTGRGRPLAGLGPEDPREVAGYRLLARIGEGGMGSVYLSRTRGNQPVALKVIRREYAEDPGFRRRFEQEALAARQVHGYHIVPVVDHDTGGPRPWLATAYVPGLPLDEVLDLHGPLPMTTVLQLVGCAAEALQAVHKAGVIHRDLKPGNVLIGSDGPWVIDFGIARAADATRLTRSGGFIGTPQFMSPEHAGGLPLTPATDVFSLGLIAAVCATGRHPYGEAGAITVATQIANTATRPPDLSGYPEPLRGILRDCLAADPGARPTPSALAGLCQDLSGRPLRDFAGWLPGPVAQDIARREREVQALARAETAAPQAPAGYGGGTTQPPYTSAPATGSGPYGATGPGAGAAGPATAGTAAAAPSAAGPVAGGTAGGRPLPPQAAPYAPGPGGGSGTGGWGPSGTGAGAAPPAPPAPPAPAAPPAHRGARPLTLGVTALALLALSAGGYVYLRDETPDKGADRGAAGQPAVPGAGAQSPAASPSGSGGTSPSPAAATASAAAPKGKTYKVLFENQSFALRWPSTGYTQFDLDTPSAFPSGAQNGRIELTYAIVGGPPDNHEIVFATPTGLSDSPAPDACRTAVGANALSGRLDAATIDKELTAGRILCTVTLEGKLAMMQIDRVEPNDGKPEFFTRLTVWSMS
ncbi:serine/threonine-protein kinase [Streptomyces sp. NPDC046876]|uniref:serine/threonine-protein kinase n=1 Tax=Streptomyces sp. NPDC046876 TaxID=3155616 RepID=UPI003410C812